MRAQVKADPLRLGFLGVGWIGRNRMDSLVSSGIGYPTAVADISRESAVAVAREDTLVLGSIEELVGCEGLDGIVIATPSALHANQAVKALEAGFPVFCQKPLGRNAEEVRGIVGAARRGDLLLGVDMSYRFMEPVRIARALLERGAIGRVYAVDTFFHNAYGPDKAWFYDPELSGGGCVIDLGIHLVDLALWFSGFAPVTDVKSCLYRQGKRIKGGCGEVEDYASVGIDLGGDIHINMACSWKLSAGCDALIGMTLYGTEGALSLQNLNGSFYDFTLSENRGTRKEVLFMPPDAWGGGALIDWAQKLSKSGSFDESIEDVSVVADVLDAVYLNS